MVYVHWCNATWRAASARRMSEGSMQNVSHARWHSRAPRRASRFVPLAPLESLQSAEKLGRAPVNVTGFSQPHPGAMYGKIAGFSQVFVSPLCTRRLVPSSDGTDSIQNNGHHADFRQGPGPSAVGPARRGTMISLRLRIGKPVPTFAYWRSDAAC